MSAPLLPPFPPDVAPLPDRQQLQASPLLGLVEVHETLTSTNDRATELARDLTTVLPALVVAGQQTAGRGRSTHTWWSPPGALMFSLVVEPGRSGIRRDQWPRISILTALSVCEVLRQRLPDHVCGLKWPNDVWLDAKKVCGILIEVPGVPPSVEPRIVIGVGLNVNNSLVSAPSEIRERATSLCDCAGEHFNVTELLLGFLASLSHHLTALGKGDPHLGAKWRSLCVLSGRQVAIKFGGREITGRCEGIDDEGALLIETGSRRERLFGGTVIDIQ